MENEVNLQGSVHYQQLKKHICKLYIPVFYISFTDLILFYSRLNVKIYMYKTV